MTESQNNKPQWAMVIDLDRCTGCEACVVACRVENNIPTVGPEEAAKGRSINWIRVERYFEGEYPDVKVKFMPVLCQHCEEAPCEPVCPVYATYRTDEGLNAQVYNRCGTRHCANNCPYKCAFFNFSIWWDARSGSEPEVSVRTRRYGEMHVLHPADSQGRRQS
jgi:molybdopterin-containing oxidoreductase family iron-sulfur binding subunit